MCSGSGLASGFGGSSFAISGVSAIGAGGGISTVFSSPLGSSILSRSLLGLTSVSAEVGGGGGLSLGSAFFGVSAFLVGSSGAGVPGSVVSGVSGWVGGRTGGFGMSSGASDPVG